VKLFKIAFAAALALGSLSAQNFAERIAVNFPAPVVVNGVTLPAGDATIQVVHNTATVMLMVRAHSGETSAVLVSRIGSEGTANKASVILDQKDGAYRLNRVILPDNTALQVLDPQ
jgi:hypothetical protein